MDKFRDGRCHEAGAVLRADLVQCRHRQAKESGKIRTGSGSGTLGPTEDVLHQTYENKKEGFKII